MKRFLTFLLVLGLLISYSATALAAPSASADYNEEAEARKSLPVQTNEIANWPTGPDLGAEAAYLLEATPVRFFMPRIWMRSFTLQVPPRFLPV